MKYAWRYLAKAVLVVVAVAALGWMVMWLWNWVIPAVFVGGRTIDYAHAFGLLVLSRILFGGFRGHGGWHARRQWRKWEAEERERFQQRMSGRCKRAAD
jgi:hypothetical protein